MTPRLETGLRLDGAGRAALERSGSLAAALRKFDWFYVGAEFCENLLESPAWHEEQAAFFLERGARVCVLTPPLSERGLRRLRPVFRRLAGFRRYRRRERARCRSDRAARGAGGEHRARRPAHGRAGA